MKRGCENMIESPRSSVTYQRPPRIRGYSGSKEMRRLKTSRGAYCARTRESDDSTTQRLSQPRQRLTKRRARTSDGNKRLPPRVVLVFTPSCAIRPPGTTPSLAVEVWQ